jgi:Uma2 family endonuclease
VSLAEYLVIIDKGDPRVEYYDGEILDIKSATETHGRICTNITTFVNICIMDKDCSIYAGDRELWIEECNRMFYPDHVIVCGDHYFKQMSKNVQATINPTVVIEVLSDSTKDFGKSEKQRCYKKLGSLKQMVFVSQKEKYVRTLTKQEDKKGWLELDYFEGDVVQIGDCEIRIEDIYRRVIFEQENVENTEGGKI